MHQLFSVAKTLYQMPLMALGKAAGACNHRYVYTGWMTFYIS
jgi:hypothetical protein